MSRIQKVILFAIFILLLSASLAGCGTSQKKQEQYLYTAVQRAAPVIPRTKPTNLQNVNVIRIETPEDVDKIRDIPGQLYIFDDNQYKILQANIKDLKRYIMEQRAVIVYLTDYTKQTN